MGESHAALVLETRGMDLTAHLLIDGRSVYSASIPSGPVQLRVAFAEGGACRFEYTPLGAASVRLAPTFQARKGRWIGAKVGLFAICGEAAASSAYADFDYFRFSPG